MDDMKSMAKKHALMKIRKMLSERPKEALDGHIAAKVVAKDPESLKEGLEKAEEVAEQIQDEAMMQYEDDMEESKEEENGLDEFADLSREELIEKLKEYKK